MKKFFRAACLCAALVGAGTLSIAQSLPTALVWIPPETFSSWAEVDTLLRARPSLKLTLALTPDMASDSARSILDPWIRQGRIDVAARIPGDPILTWVASHPVAPRPQDVLDRAVEAREGLKQRLGAPAPGLVVGSGALDPSLTARIGATGATWVLAGPYASNDAIWVAAGKSLLVPTRSLPQNASEAWAAPGACVYDESSSTTSVFVTELNAQFAAAHPDSGWASVSDIARTKGEPRREASEIALWPPWDPNVENSPSTPEGKAAWDVYGAAPAAIDRYQNSGAAELKTLDAAVEFLRKAQASRHYRANAQAYRQELRAPILALYKRLKQSAPESLYGPNDASASGSSGDGPTGVKIAAGPSWIELRGPAGTLALAPVLSSAPVAASTAPFIDGGAAADPWRIQSLRAEWDDASVKLILGTTRASTSVPRPVYEIYMDINHVLGAGSVPLLEGRGAIVPARDAWELVLSIAGAQAWLYRARVGGDPEEIAAPQAVWSSGRPEVTVTVPRSAMRGNPARWGWAIVAFAEDPARPNRRPSAPLVAPNGTILLGLLAPKDVQTAVLTRTASRVSASRLEP